jgi:hypothetical protein
MNLEGVVVVDGFYARPEQVRELALRAEYQSFGDRQNFAGRESVKAYFQPGHVARFEQLLGGSLDVDPAVNVFGKFRWSIASDPARTRVHFDKVSWTAVVYLSRPEHCRGGLGLYRQRETGLAEVPRSEEALRRYGCRDAVEFDRRYVLPRSTDEAAWEQIGEVPIRYNRLVLFQGGRYFHAITEQFGTSLADSRLTQNFFFNDPRERGAAAMRCSEGSSSPQRSR